MDKETFRKHGYEFIDWVADYLENVGEYRICPDVRPGEIKQKLPKEAPGKGESLDIIFNDFKRKIFPGMTHWQHPSWFAYFPANNSPPSVLAELLTAGMGAQCMIWETSPAAAELEEVVMEWLKSMLALPKGMTGVIQDTASTSSLVALLTAREKATGFESNVKGFKEPLVIYCSEESHSSVEKGAKIAGFGKENIRHIPTDKDYAVLPGELEKSIFEDMNKGLKPCCVVATVGTTSSSAIDPLDKIGEICKRYNIWLHVDAAYAGTASVLPEKRWMFKGIEYADSFVFNPHKWMLTNFDCSAYFVKEPDLLVRTFEIHPEYLKTGVDSQVKNYRDWGIALGRRFRALKLWFVLRYYGIEGIQEMVRKHIELAQSFKDKVEGSPSFELMAPVPLSLVCFRLNDGSSEGELNRMNRRLLEAVNQTGKLHMTHTTLKGKYVIRLCVASRTTEKQDVERAWELIDEKAREILTPSST
ncbi:MAG: aminotransferase class V-fold PLP-dependent enzyme [Candidatus Aminicenantes bacterium]|nr:aminotransferase class V-fold PLP-dependent enzyme [Candidatus Aminicenantes bacterium]HHF51449.1 aminotransferase class V-fold PLP-dependent enzyme [Candidatus Aminicenantes bacterium]